MIEPIIKAVPMIPVYYYHFPAMSGININLCKMLKMGRDERKMKSLVGAKFTSLDFQELSNCVNEGFHILCGYNHFLLNTLNFGGHGGISRDANYAGSLQKKIFKNFEKQNYQKALFYQNKNLELYEIENSLKGGMSMYKYLMSRLRGINMGGSRNPIRNLTLEEKQLIDASIERIKELIY